jgi:D-glycero-alpha-D-manno-heptose-7-phosphate kinase
MIISRTPFRVSFLGGGTDYPSWSRKHGGLVVGGAINRHCHISARYLPPYHDYKTRVVYSAIEAVKDNSEIQHRAIRGVLAFLGLDKPDGPGLEIFHQSDIPGRSGTGSSSSFVVGLVHALKSLKGWYASPAELANDATFIEQVSLAESVGNQDQLFAAYGGLRYIRFRPDGDMTIYPIPLNPEKVKELEQHLLLFFTGVARTSSDVAKQYVPTLAEREQEQWAMLRLAEDGIEAVHRCQWELLGQLIDKAWRIKSSFPGVSSPSIDNWYCMARLSGAWGGKITGAGGGGCMLLVAPPEKRAAIVDAMQNVGMVHIPFRFDLDGSSIVYCDKTNQ